MKVPGLQAIKDAMRPAIVDIAGYLDSEFGKVTMDEEWFDRSNEGRVTFMADGDTVTRIDVSLRFRRRTEPLGLRCRFTEDPLLTEPVKQLIRERLNLLHDSLRAEFSF